MIKYHPCKSTVSPPSDWDPAVVARSADPPGLKVRRPALR